MKRKVSLAAGAGLMIVLLFLLFSVYMAWSQVLYTEIVSFVEPYRDNDWTVYFPWYPVEEDRIVQCSENQVDYTIEMFKHLLYDKVLMPDKIIEEQETADNVEFEITVKSGDEQTLLIKVFYLNSKKYIVLQSSDETHVYKVSEIGTGKRITIFAFDLDCIGSL